MPRQRPNRLRDRLKRILMEREGTIIPYATLAWLLYPNDMPATPPEDPFVLEGNQNWVPDEVMVKLSDTMRGLREEDPANLRAFKTVRGEGYMYKGTEV